jgi:hypothetical protein
VEILAHDGLAGRNEVERQPQLLRRLVAGTRFHATILPDWRSRNHGRRA